MGQKLRGLKDRLHYSFLLFVVLSRIKNDADCESIGMQPDAGRKSQCCLRWDCLWLASLSRWRLAYTEARSLLSKLSRGGNGISIMCRGCLWLASLPRRNSPRNKAGRLLP